MLGLYVIYGQIRNANDSSQQAVEKAYENAERIISIEEKLGLLVENAVQNFFIDHTVFIQFWNLYYGFFHFAATIGALIAIYLYRPKTYGYWRTVGISATGLALIGYATFPLMPPRLVSKCKDDVYGSMCDERFTFVDTVVEMGGLWSFESEGMAAVSNQFAAMPSLHIGWALWCGLILFKESSALWAKMVAIAYPILTLFAIVVTANHWWLDAIGGAFVVGLGVVFATILHSRINASIFKKPEFS